MTTENDFLIFSGGSSANVETQAQYAADAALTNGVSTGLAKSTLYNKVARQASIMANTIASFIIQQLPTTPVVDNGSAGAAAILANFTAALQNLFTSQYTSGSNSNGSWRKSPDGFIEQWGTVTAPAEPSMTSTVATVTFPIGFTTIAGVNANPLQNASGSEFLPSCGIPSQSNTGCSIKLDVLGATNLSGAAASFTNSVNIFWRATGR